MTRGGPGPLLTAAVAAPLAAARAAGRATLECSLDLGVSRTTVEVGADAWCWRGQRYPYVACKERTVYHWDGGAFAAVARYGGQLVKLVPTDWGPPTFELDGVKMLPTATVSPLEDARAKVRLVEPRGRRVLDTCGGLGYFARACLEQGATGVHSFEKSAEVRWLRTLNPWSPPADAALTLEPDDVAEAIALLPAGAYGAALHDPPRFGLAGELYAGAFYQELARVMTRGAWLFHYTGAPNQRSRGRDLAGEVVRRLGAAGFVAERALDGVRARRR